MKILIIMPCLLPVPAFKGGAVETLITALLDKNEIYRCHDISLITMEYGEKTCSYKYTKFFFLKKNVVLRLCEKIFRFLLKKDCTIFTKFAVVRFARDVLKENSFDAVVLQNNGFLLNIFSAKKLQRKYNGRVFYHLHNAFPKTVKKRVACQVKYILISDFLRRSVENALGEDAERVYKIVKNGIDTARFSQKMNPKERNEMRALLNIDPGKKMILFVGRLTQEKGLLPLLSALNKMSSAVLVVVGSTYFGANKVSKFEQKLKEMTGKMKEKIRFTGFVHNSAVWKYYIAADCVVLPSVWDEPAGLTMLEAGASGTPLITTNRGGIPEYIDSEYADLLDVDEHLDEKIVECVKNIAERKNSLLLQKRICQNFNYDVFYRNFFKALDE